jgi:hypothetical protein
MLSVMKPAALARTAAAAVTAAGLALTSAAPAQALGDNERAFLQGVLATVVVGEVIRASRGNGTFLGLPTGRNTAPVTRYDTLPAPVYTTPVNTYVPPRAPAPTYTYVPEPVYAPAYSSSTAAGLAFRDLGRYERLAVQRNLARWGYYTGAIDGVWGPRTARAVSAYAADAGLGLATYGAASRVMQDLSI